MKTKLVTVVVMVVLLSSLVMPLLMSEVKADPTYDISIGTPKNGQICVVGSGQVVDGLRLQLIPDSRYYFNTQPADGYTFSHWVIDGFNVTDLILRIDYNGANRTLQAVFIANPLYVLPTNGPDWPMEMHDAGRSGSAESQKLTNQILWTRSFDGEYFNSRPVSVDGIVYAAGAYGVYAINASTIQELWHYEASDDTQFFVGSPAVADGTVYVSINNGFVVALNAENGEELWVAENSAGSYSRQGPIVYNGTVYVATDAGYIYAFDTTNDGEQLWQSQIPSDVINGIVNIAVADGVVCVCTDMGYACGLSCATGDLLWHRTLETVFDSCPAIADGVAYICSEQGGIYGFDVTTADSNGNIVWQYATGDDGFHDGAAVADGVLYAPSNGGYVYALDTSQTAEQALLWRYQVQYDNFGRFGGETPTVAGGIVFVVSDSGVIYALDTAPETQNGQEIWNWVLEWSEEDSFVVAPSVADGVIYATSYGGTVYALAANARVTFTEAGLADGASWSVTFDGITQTPSSDTITYVVCQRGEFSYSISTPDGYHTSDTLTGTIGVSHEDSTTSVTFEADAPSEYTLTTEVYVDGVFLGSNQHAYDAGSERHGYLVEIPPQYTYDHLSLDGVNSTETEYRFTMDQNRTLQLFFNTTILQLTVNAGTGGTVDPSDATQTYRYGDIANLTATAAPGYGFAYWAIDDQTNSTDNPLALAMDGNHTVTAVFIEKPTTIVASDSNQTYTVRLEGNITAKQMSNMTITPHQETSTTNVEFTVTGPSGTVGYGTIILPKEAIPYGSTPLVYIDGVLAENQTYTEDDNYYYISYSTHFSTHGISIIFTSPPLSTTPIIPRYTMPTNHTQPTTIPSPTPIPTPTTTPTATPQPTINPPTQSGNADTLIVAAAAILLFVIVVGLFYRKKQSKRW